MRSFVQSNGGQYLYEATPGKSNALNTALDAARGELIVFTDDDVIPDPEWISAYVQAARAHPEILGFAGQIRLHWPSAPPAWLAELERMGRTLGATPTGRTVGFVQASEVKGANAAVRRSALDVVHRFRRDLGVSSSGPVLAGEETAFFQALEEVGHRTWFVPQARLLHMVRPYQMSVRSLMRRGFRNGRGGAAIAHEPLPPSRLVILGLPAYAWLNLLKVGMQALRRMLRLDTAGAACDLLRVSEMAGSYTQRARHKV